MKQQALWLYAACLILTGCDETATVEQGIEVEVQMSNAPVGNDCAEGVEPGEEGQSFCTSTGERIDLINGLVAPAQLRLVECTSVAALLRGVLGGLVGEAHAHGGHVDAPPGVVDVAEPTGTTWQITTMPATPGRYCGVEFSLAHLPSTILPHDTVPEPHDDIYLYARPCHFPNPPPEPPAHNHSCYTVAIHGTPPLLQFDFAQPVTLNSGQRQMTVTLDTHYDAWFDDIDFTQIQSSQQEQQKLVQNMLASLVLRSVQTGGAP
jgi:hypothetical protein